jgi:Domain of Unknown Function (DUF1080)
VITALTLALIVSVPQWTPLFDGKSLSGWKQLNGTATYAIEKGELVGRTAKGSPNSFLCTEKLYGDFELEFEVKVDPTLNSGVQFRSVSVPGYQAGRVHGYQAEIDPSDRKWSGGLYDEGRQGWLQDLSKNERGQKAFKNGKWNKYRIVAKGDHIQIWVNGIQTADAHDELTRFGFFGLQVHSSDNDGLEVRWRNLRVKDFGIPTSSPPKTGRWLLRDEKDVSANWMLAKDSSPCPWKWENGAIVSGGGDICTKVPIGDSRMHVEFMTDDNGLEGQANGNSGIYFMESYEVQILNSAPRLPLNNECGAIYSVKAPDYAMAYKAGVWQTYDVVFTAPRYQGDTKVTNAKFTVYHNGTRIHKDVEVPRATAAGRAEAKGIRPFRLQDHGNKIRFRNIWVEELKS